jgi:hypothetical protein
MSSRYRLCIAALPAMLLTACVPVSLDDDAAGGISIVLPTGDDIGPTIDATGDDLVADGNASNQSTTGEPLPGTTPLPEAPLSTDDPAKFETQLLEGRVVGATAYELFDLGPGATGDTWEVTYASGTPRFTVVFMDAQFNLLHRSVLSLGQTLRHTLRSDTPSVRVGITPGYGYAGGSYTLRARAASVGQTPAPRQQVVYVDFGAASGIDVNYRSDISFPAFTGQMLGDRYTDDTTRIKAIILDELQRDYANYDVVFYSSDEGPPPVGEYSTLHFGGEGDGLLGLADNVDQYNSDVAQRAIVFTNTFAIYEVMALTTDEMAQMVANTASHELGHLLGLFHTRDVGELMDTSANAWELTENQVFKRAVLHETVFPYGFEDTPALLNQIVGPHPAGVLSAAQLKSLTRQKDAVRNAMREMFVLEAPHRCGICARPLD